MIVTRGLGVGSGVGSLTVAGMGGWSVEIAKKVKRGGRGLKKRDVRFFRLVKEKLTTPPDSQKSDEIAQEILKRKPKPDVLAVSKSVVSKTSESHRDFSERSFLKWLPPVRGYVDVLDITQIRITLLGMMDKPDENKAAAMFAEIIRRLVEDREEEDVVHLISMLV